MLTTILYILGTMLLCYIIVYLLMFFSTTEQAKIYLEMQKDFLHITTCFIMSPYLILVYLINIKRKREDEQKII
jgi:uncharacterized membrane protein